MELQDICIGYEELPYLSSLSHVLWSNSKFVLDTDPGKRRIQTDCPLYNILILDFGLDVFDKNRQSHCENIADLFAVSLSNCHI